MNTKQLVLIILAISTCSGFAMEIDDAEAHITADNGKNKTEYFTVLYDLQQVERTMSGHALAFKKYKIMKPNDLIELSKQLQQKKETLQNELSPAEQLTEAQRVATEIATVDNIQSTQKNCSVQ